MEIVDANLRSASSRNEQIKNYYWIIEDCMMNKKLDLSDMVITPDMFKNIDISNLLSAAEVVGIDDHSNFTPHELLKDFMNDVRSYWLGGCAECEYESDSLVQCSKSAMVLLYALMKYKELGEERQQ